MPDYSATEIAAFGGFTFTAGIIISFVMQAAKDFVPQLSGRWAVAIVYAIGFLSALAIVDNSEPAPDWGERGTWYAVIPLAFVLSETARGAYERIFKRALGSIVEMVRNATDAGANVTASATTEPDGVTITTSPAAESLTLTERYPRGQGSRAPTRPAPTPGGAYESAGRSQPRGEAMYRRELTPAGDMLLVRDGPLELEQGLAPDGPKW